MCSVVYGWPALEVGSPEVAQAFEFANRISEATVPGNFLVDIFPLLNFLPSWIAPWKRQGKALHDRLTVGFEKYISGVAEKLVCLLVQCVRIAFILTLRHRCQETHRHATLRASYKPNINMGLIEKSSLGMQQYSCKQNYPHSS